MLDHLGTPHLPLLRIPRHGIPYRLQQIPSTTWFHNQIEALLILEILKDSHHMWMVKAFQHGKLLAHTLVGRLGLVRAGLLDDLAHADTGVVGAMSHFVDRSKTSFAQLPALAVDFLEPLGVLLQELFSPSLVTLLASLGAAVGTDLHLATGQHEGQHSKEQSLVFFGAQANRACLGVRLSAAVLLKKLPHCLFIGLVNHL
mmetsp:Transcript_47099/g.102585  ORF Transcript_47099/g.102585 Transcript_47099/m.102585 type:complete len:201 (-) Transcript_47099:171-773(-)